MRFCGSKPTWQLWALQLQAVHLETWLLDVSWVPKETDTLVTLSSDESRSSRGISGFPNFL